MKSHGEIWDECLEIIRDNVSENVFGTWFVPVVPFRHSGDEFVIQVPSQFFCEFLEEHYADLIYQALARVSGNTNIRLIYRSVVDSTSPKGGGCDTTK
ncbi:hypothetical protein AGMMS49965_13050 [Bacteroidia bacterium]|nr:hypothetical protein AGMMS49965_13050 [Bacteroidia bacterium]